MKYDIGLDIGVASTGLAVVNEEGKVLESVASLYNEADAKKSGVVVEQGYTLMSKLLEK